MAIYKEPPPGMFVVPDPQDMTKVKKKAQLFSIRHVFSRSVYCKDQTTTRLYFLKIASHVSVKKKTLLSITFTPGRLDSPA